ncbi:MAG: decaprenyl-phosphate phosphoribosyltransferase [Synechocystis sp.]|jgi:4-hydroxybenzoate polyprenyltransferase
MTRSNQRQKSTIISPYIQALRPRQWTKNLIVFAAPLFAFQIDAITLFKTILTYVFFCSISSSFYLINDIIDVEADRQHPTKCKRPIASGKVKVPTATLMAAILLGLAIVGSYILSQDLGLTIMTYALLQVGYNLKFKRVVILDIMSIAIGFVLRAIGGGVANQIHISSWFILCTAMLALFLGIEKRKAELRKMSGSHGKTRSVLKQYTHKFLERMEGIVTSGTIITYAIWCSGPMLGGASTRWMLLTFPFVLYGLFRYQLLSDPDAIEEKTEKPEEILLTDYSILLTVILWIITIFLILYCKHLGIIS